MSKKVNWSEYVGRVNKAGTLRVTEVLPIGHPESCRPGRVTLRCDCIACLSSSVYQATDFRGNRTGCKGCLGKYPQKGSTNRAGSLIVTEVLPACHPDSCNPGAVTLRCDCAACLSSSVYHVRDYMINRTGCKGCLGRFPQKGSTNRAGSLIVTEVLPIGHPESCYPGRVTLRCDCTVCTSSRVYRVSHFGNNSKGCIDCAQAANNQTSNYNWYAYGPDGNTVPMRSSWEVEVANFLNELDVKWEYEPVKLSVGKRTYTPDFRLSPGNFIEVKGFDKKPQRVKREALRKQGFVIELWDKSVLKSLGLLKRELHMIHREAASLDMTIEDFMADSMYRRY